MDLVEDFMARNMEMLKILADDQNVGVWINSGDGQILYASRGVREQYGVDPAVLLGHNSTELVETGLASGQSLPETLRTRAISKAECVTKIGKKVSIICYPFFKKNGKLWRVVGISRIVGDISGDREDNAEEESSSPIHIEEKLKEPFIAVSSQMRAIMESLERLGRSDATVMIRGESGVGKDGIAYRLHKFSRRADQPYVVINCATIPENLIESELFGYEKGAFTNATSSKMGLFEMANHGTIFLDEVGDMPLAVQVKLLRCIQNRQILRVGGKKMINLDVRFITATNQPVEEMVAAGKFREDLYYRLNVIKLIIPPLRERYQDIMPLARHFLGQFNKKYETKKQFSKAVQRIFHAYSWPGNVRELENTVEHAVALCPFAIIGPQFVPQYITDALQKKGEGEVMTLKEATEACEKKLLAETMLKYPSSRKAAQVLGCDQTTVLRKLKKYGLTYDAPEGGEKKNFIQMGL
ncbi:sigma 54-interacting transcriptional regulator [uncultured Mailhella sp.]|uniref:sigma-54 interaction domain-containing protein n=1 Tax=uncultured Mailhella sp. TaxID=1981031 RepID=UPI0025E6D573|nr:sigma 54-interacting transcriptional regulator [uncultured Mailhella sp.]